MTGDSPLFSPEMLADPYAAYARLRAEDPVHWHEPMAAWILTNVRLLQSLPVTF
ncbi:MAG TPA: hypothetical protein VMS64_15615 [Candidatus Methylomirabilis sp.]|nr:hypothetical protein [Candidatus Methylomirabilis sp.]